MFWNVTLLFIIFCRRINMHINSSQGRVRYSSTLGMSLCHMCFTHLFSMLYLLLLLVSLYGMSTGFHMESVFIFIHNRPLGIHSSIVRSSPINFLPDLPSIQVSPTYHFKHNNKPFPFSKKELTIYHFVVLPLWTQLYLVLVGHGLEESGILLIFPLCKL